MFLKKIKFIVLSHLSFPDKHKYPSEHSTVLREQDETQELTTTTEEDDEDEDLQEATGEPSTSEIDQDIDSTSSPGFQKPVKVSFSGDRSTETEWRIPPQEQITMSAKEQQVSSKILVNNWLKH